MEASPEQQAVDWMKAGHGPDSVRARLRAQGVSDFEAHALIEKLVSLQNQAAALDPKRLREEAKWMLMRGTPIDQVLDHWKNLGIADEHARPEIQRLLAEVRDMRPCDRCCTPMALSESFFDVQGRKICRTCNTQDELGMSQRRATVAQLESMVLPGLTGLAATAAVSAMTYGMDRPTTAAVPWCQHCRIPGVGRAALHPQMRDRIHPGWTYVCHQCFAGLR